MSYPAPTSCCDKCEVAASAVQVVFWPPADASSNSSVGSNITGSINWNVTAAPVQSAASYGLVEDGFTFISPSVYVIYSSIQASASCVALFNSHIPIGSAYTAVTRAYEPNVLSSAICEAENMGAGIEYCISPVGDQDDPNYCFQGIDNGWRQINFSELYDPPPASHLLTRYQSCFPGHSINADFASMMFVKPQLAFPPDVTDIDPVWATWGGSTCTPVNLGVFDPPRVLQKATALAPVPTPATDPQAVKAPPSPAATLKSPLAAPTTQGVTGADPNSGVKANDPGSNDAGKATPTIAQSDPVATIVDPVDPSTVAQNEGSPATGNSGAVKAGSNTDSNSDPGAVVDPVNGSISEQNEASPTIENSDVVNPSSSPDSYSDSSSGNTNTNPVADGGDTAPADTEKQSGANTATSPGTNSGTDSGTENNDPSTAPITLLPQQTADTAKENSGTIGSNGKIGVTTGGTNGDSSGGTIGGTDGGTSNDSNGDTNGGTNSGANVGNSGGLDAANSGSTSGDTSGGNEGDSNGGTKIGTSGGSDGDGHANPAPIASVNSQPITKDASGNIVLSGSTLAPGSTAVFSGHTIANAPSAIVMDGSTYALSPTTPSPLPLLVNNQLLQMTNGRLEIGSQTLVPGTYTTINNHVVDYANPSQVIEDGVTHNLAPVFSSNPLVLNDNTLQRAANGGLITAGTTIAPGSTAAISGHVYSLAGSSSVIMDGNTYALPAATNAYQIQAATSSAPTPPSIVSGPLTLANGLVITAQPPTSSDTAQNYILPNGASLSAGGSTAVFSGTTYSALPSDAGIVAAGPSGSSTLVIPTLPPTATRSIYTAAGATFTPQATGFAIGGTTLTPGGQALTTGGIVVSLGPSGTFVMGSSTMILPSQSIFAAAGATFTAQADGFDVGTTSLTPGGAAYTTDGTVISLGTNAVLAIGSTTYDLGPQSVFTVDGQTFMAQPTGFMIGSQTVLPGSTGVDEGGETVSLGANGVLQLGSKTVTLASSTGLGGAIVFGLDGGSGSGSGVVFEGAAWRTGVCGLGILVGVLGTIGAVVL
ncbi:MAG: hypothetical protein ASARMPREDX12_006808 [Alectoria sarmentosa]|nr:MAG: hypothetical protein ASARMPREDX12_006808 [Alectoria sarmentosa]